MCGIIGYTGKRQAKDILLRGLYALEYRGYDSAGIALSDSGSPEIIKCAGRISVLEEKLSSNENKAKRGIAHTRWATHGSVSDRNSHPHRTDTVCLVHNGIIENYFKIEKELEGEYQFKSSTDTEAALALIDREYKRTKNAGEAIFSAISKIEGSFAFGIIFCDKKEKIYAIKRQSPLVAAISPCGGFISSDVTPLLEYTKEVYRPEDEILTVISPSSVEFFNSKGERIDIFPEKIEWTVEEAKKDGFKHFMQKELYEIPSALRKTLSSFTKNSLPSFPELEGIELEKIKRIHIAACGTAMHAGLIGKRLIENNARIPVNVEIASEFRYSNRIIEDNELVLLLSQSGETADTLACLRFAKENKIKTLAIVNVVGSTIAREADAVLYTRAGPEIAVASTKAYTTQCSLLALLSLHLARIKGRMEESEILSYTDALLHAVPSSVEEIFKAEDKIKAIAKEIKDAEHIFFIGRGVDFDVCTEGSLKLKEISYIHSEGYAAGELKHGTISLIEKGVPVISCISDVSLSGKMLSGMREVESRGGEIYAFMTKEISEENDFPHKMLFEFDTLPHSLSFFPEVSALQLLAYHVSDAKGLDVDKPRNLAKSVTVE